MVDKAVALGYNIKALTNENGITVTAKDKVAGKAGAWKQSVKVYDDNGKALGKADYDAASIKYYLVKPEEEIYVYEKELSLVTEKELTKDDTVEAGRMILVSVAGKGLYQPAGTEVALGTYRILAKGYDIAKAKIQIANKDYTGREIYLEGKDILGATLKVNGTDTKLILGEQIQIVEGSYQKNIKKGTAKVTFRGIGDFGGTKTVSFKIVSQDAGKVNWEVIYDILQKLFS